ncbi:MAG: outer membrane beta-barrel protein, partial [Prevotella sp.]
MAGIDFYGYTDSYEPMRRTTGLVTVDARLRKSFFKDRLVFLLQASDLTKSNRERWAYYGTDVISRKDANNFTRNISLTVTYNFNATRSRYKGTGAGNEEKKRL